MRPRQLRDEDPVRRTAPEVVSAAHHPRNPVVKLPCGNLIIETLCIYCGEGGWKNEVTKAEAELRNNDLLLFL